MDDDLFLPLPDYHWDYRPLTLPLDEEECATALHLTHGHLSQAAHRLRVSSTRLNRAIKQSARLQTLLRDLSEVFVADSYGEAIHALYDSASDNRRREWGASVGMRSNLGKEHLLTSSQGASASSIGGPSGGRIVLYWDDSPGPDPAVSAIEHDRSDVPNAATD